MEQKCMISIIIPVYQAEKTLERTLESVLAQTYRDYEVIIVDDGSTDGSPAVYGAYAERFPSCRAIRQENTGVSSARNNGIRQAGGKYILFLDSDDLLASKALETMVNTAEEYQTDLVIGNYAVFYDHENPAKKDPWVHDIIGYVSLMHREDAISLFGNDRTSLLGVCVWGKLYRRDLILDHGILFPEDVNYEEDCQFNLLYYRQIKDAVCLRKVVNYYRIKERSLSRTYRESQFGFLVQGYNQRKSLAEELGPEGLPGKIDEVFYKVVLMQIKKVSMSALRRKEKRGAYRHILTQPESGQALRAEPDDVSLFTRILARTCLKQRYTAIEFLLLLWKKKKSMEKSQEELCK